MFTGLIEEVGRITAVQPQPGGKRFAIEAHLATEMELGDSLAVNGVCLTAERIEMQRDRVVVSAVTETLRRSTAGRWRPGTRVHLERALQAGARLGGHLMQGHVDGVARVIRAGREGRDFILALRIPPGLRRYIVSKGSLAVDGMSLTVGDLRAGACRLYIIPETLSRTVVQSYRPGDPVNIEVDLVAKYVESLGRAAKR